MKKKNLTLLCTMLCINVFSQYSAACYGSWPEWPEILNLKDKVENANFLSKEKKAELLGSFEKLKVVRDGFYYGTNNFCKKWKELDGKTRTHNTDADNLGTAWTKYKAEGCEGEVDQSKYASCLSWYNELIGWSTKIDTRKAELDGLWAVLENEGYQLLNVEATNNNNAFIKNVKKVFENLSYHDSLVYKYGSPENVRLKHIPKKSKLKRFLVEFYIKKDGTVIPIKGSSAIHTNRNKYNVAPSKLSVIKGMKDWSKAWLDLGYHGGKTEFRGKGKYAGCQAVYNKDGSLDDNTKYMGTFDYAYCYCGGVSVTCYFKHKKWDIVTHDDNDKYKYGLTSSL